MRLGEVVHALGFSIRYPRRIARGQAEQETSKDVIYQHLRTLPENIDMELQGVEEGKHKQLIHQVIVDVIENSPLRSPEVNYLKPYMIQEGLLIGQEESLDSFNTVYSRFRALLDVLHTLISLHDIIHYWSIESSTVVQRCERPI